MQRETDIALQQKAAWLKLSFIRDHLPELLDAAEQTRMTPREQLDYFLTREIEQRNANRFRQGLMEAHFPAVKTLDSFDFTKQPSIDPDIIRELKKLEWLRSCENVTLFGPPGGGKTYLAIGLGRLAVEQGISVRFYTAAGLLALLEKAVREETLEAKMKELVKPQLVIIDEIGYLPYTPEAARLLFMVVSRRYERKSLMTTSNRPSSEWGLIFADSTTASAILDRLLHHCTVMTILGESYRLQEQKKAGLRFKQSNEGAQKPKKTKGKKESSAPDKQQAPA